MRILFIEFKRRADWFNINSFFLLYVFFFLIWQLFEKVSDLIHIIAQYLGAYPHGLITLNRIQNMTNSYFNLERVITTQQLDYNVNLKLLSSSLLGKMDRDSDGLVSQSDYVYSVLGLLKYMNATLSPKVEENLKSYFEIYYSSIQSLLTKYGLSDFGLCIK